MTPLCSCQRPMVERINKQTGKKFYGCAKFGRGGCNEAAEHETKSYTLTPEYREMEEDRLWK